MLRLAILDIILSSRAVGSDPLYHSLLSVKTSFRGPLVAQTSIRGLAQPCGAERAQQAKEPANEAVLRRSSPSVAVPDAACHAGGRGFESRRSRLANTACALDLPAPCPEPSCCPGRGPNLFSMCSALSLAPPAVAIAVEAMDVDAEDPHGSVDVGAIKVIGDLGTQPE